MNVTRLTIWTVLCLSIFHGCLHGQNPAENAATPAEVQNASAATDDLSEGNIIALDLGEGVAMKFVKIPAGEFIMGSDEGEKGREEDESPQRKVTISKPFYMGVYEVTQEQYKLIMGKNPSRFKDPARPVERASWELAMEFCAKVSEMTGKTITLPTEAQWEYACRAGSTSRFHFGDDDYKLSEYARFIQGFNDWTAPVGQFKPNDWGLYDMHGNVWEWCLDLYERFYDAEDLTDPAGPEHGELKQDIHASARVVRGGSWFHRAISCRSANRNKLAQTYRELMTGFRVVMLD